MVHEQRVRSTYAQIFLSFNLFRDTTSINQSTGSYLSRKGVGSFLTRRQRTKYARSRVRYTPFPFQIGRSRLLLKPKYRKSNLKKFIEKFIEIQKSVFFAQKQLDRFVQNQVDWPNTKKNRTAVKERETVFYGRRLKYETTLNYFLKRRKVVSIWCYFFFFIIENESNRVAHVFHVVRSL